MTRRASDSSKTTFEGREGCGAKDEEDYQSTVKTQPENHVVS
jgi:hypothetical protein